MSRAGGPQILAQRVDWPRLIVDLTDRGFELADLGKRCGVSEKSIFGWRDYGREPLHANGEKLVVLWVTQTGRSRDSVPIRRLVTG